MLPRPLQAVVFDMDGLLVETEGPFRDAMMAAVQDMGQELPLEVFLRMVGGNIAGSNRVLMDHFGSGFDLERFWTVCRTHAREIFEVGVELKAGVVELLDQLDEAGLPRAIATSSSHDDVDRNLIPHGLKNRFHAIVAAGDYARGKPNPDPFLTAAERLGVDPAHCLALEDSHNGVRAAAAAGMMTVMVPDLLTPTEEMRRLCVQVAESLHEVRDLVAAMAGRKEPR